jgi:hypothetical protein
MNKFIIVIHISLIEQFFMPIRVTIVLFNLIKIYYLNQSFLFIKPKKYPFSSLQISK